MINYRKEFFVLGGILSFCLLLSGCLGLTKDKTTVKPGRVPESLATIPSSGEEETRQVNKLADIADVDTENLEKVILKTNMGDISFKLSQ